MDERYDARDSHSRLRLKRGLPPTPQVDRLGWTAGAAVDSFGVRVGLRTSSPEALALAAGRLPPGRFVADGRVDLLYSLALGGDGPRAGVRSSHRLYFGGVRLSMSLDLEPVLETLESHARLQVATRSRRGVFLHAGAVAWRGRAIVLPGASRAGKTTLVKELVKAGAGYLSDEFAVIRGDRVVPYPKPLSVRERGGRGRQKAVPAAALGGWHEPRPVPVGLVVLARYERRAGGRAARLPRARAMLALLAHAPAARIAPQEVLAAVEGVVRAAPVVRVRRGEARSAVRSILGWLQRPW